MNKTVPDFLSVKSISLLLVLMLLAGCATPRPEAMVKVYDFGPAPVPTATSGALPSLAAVALFEPQVSPALEGLSLIHI